MTATLEEQIFQEARLIPDRGVRSDWIRRRCGEDGALVLRIEALLQVHDQETSFLETPVVEYEPVEPSMRDNWIGASIGPYRLVEILGEGGFGIVFRAEQLEPIRRQVAVKLIKPGMDTREVIARFENEQQALAVMDHPNIARVLDGGATPTGRPFFVMDLVEGIPVTRFADRLGLGLRERIEIMLEILAGVQHAHQKGVMHRDLKPSNLLVSNHEGHPQVKIIDFGIAKATRPTGPDATVLTRAAQWIGTPMYMSPEQAAGGGLSVDTRSDIYSLGVVLYELLCGLPPFDREQFQGTDWAEMLRIIRDVEPPKPSSRIGKTMSRTGPEESARNFPTSGQPIRNIASDAGSHRLARQLQGDLDWVVMRCLAKEPDRRYPTVAALADDLHRYLQNDPVEARPPSTWYRVSKFTHKHRAALAVTTAIVLLVVVGAAISGRQAIRAWSAERRAKKDRDNALAAYRLANDESATSRAVNDFLLKDLLGQADIGNQLEPGARNPDLTVKQLLDRALQRLPDRFADQPRTAAALRSTLGQAYAALGQLAVAEQLLREALEFSREMGGADSEQALAAEQALGWLILERGDARGAEQIFRRVVDVYQQRLGRDDRVTLSALNMLGSAYRQMGRLPEAEALLTEVHQRRERTLGPEHSDTLQSLNNLGVLHGTLGRFATAEEHFRRTRDGYVALDGIDHPRTMAATGGLASVLLMQKKYAEAEPLLLEALDVSRRSLGPQHPQTSSYSNDLAVLYSETNRGEQAGELYEKVVEQRLDQFGPQHPKTLDAQTNLAIHCAQNGDSERAQVLFENVLAVQRRVLGNQHQDTIMSMNNLAYFRQTLGQLESAAELMAEAVPAAQGLLGKANPNVLLMMNNLALVRLELGQAAEAEPVLREALAARATAPKDSTAYLEQAELLATCLLVQKKFAEAEPLARECFAARQDQQGWRAAYARGLLGACLAGQAERAEAESLLTRAHEEMSTRLQEIAPENRFCYRHLLQWLVDFYAEDGDAERAAEFAAELASFKLK